jgi:hypothetical protein
LGLFRNFAGGGYAGVGNFPNDFGKIGKERFMGGSGSGRTSSFGLLAEKCADYRSIDLAWLRKQNCLRPGYSGRMTWSRGGAVRASIGYRIEALGLRLNYRHQRQGETEWHDFDELIAFTRTDTAFNGTRLWFKCPSCQRPCRIIYGGALFRCRRCYRLKYETQYEPGFARAASRAHKIRARLGDSGSLDDPLPPKPKHMHARNHLRLRESYEACLAHWSEGIFSLARRHG